LVGVGTFARDGCIAGAAQNGIGAIVEVFNGTKWSKSIVQAGLLLDAATSNAGVSVATSMLQVLVSRDNKEFTVASVQGVSQAAYTFGVNNDIIGLVGGWIVKDSKVPTTLYGVATSHDFGVTWELSSAVPAGYVRYGAFPTEQTWFISSGMWGAYESNKDHQLSSWLSVDTKSTLTVGDRAASKGKASAARGATGWFGAVSKTTDGGKTWTQVFTSDLDNDYYYFNGIACSSVDHCTVVGEGDDGLGGYLNVAYTTFDGGNTWERVLSAGDVSMMGVDYINDSEGWLVGTKKSGRNLSAQFYHTIDGGKSFVVEETLDNCFAIDLDFAFDGTAIAACSSSSGSACYAALYH